MNDNGRVLYDIVGDIVGPYEYRKNKRAFVKLTIDGSARIIVQKSQFGEQFYVNIKLCYCKKLESQLDRGESDIETRANALLPPNDQRLFHDSLDFNSAMKIDDRRRILMNSFKEYVLPWMRSIEVLSDFVRIVRNEIENNNEFQFLAGRRLRVYMKSLGIVI